MSNAIPPGKYRARAVRTETDNGSTYAQFGAAQTGTKQVLVNFQITRGELEGITLPWRGYFTEKTAERTIQALRYCGFKGDDLSAIVDQELTQEVEIVVENEVSSQNGRTYAKIAWVNQVGGMGMKVSAPMARDDLKRFAAEMKTVVAKTPAVEAPKEAPATNDEPLPPPIDDDIPF